MKEEIEKVLEKYFDMNHDWPKGAVGDLLALMSPKCHCACHQNKLKKSYQHDTKCCDEMNGEIAPAEVKGEKYEWKHSGWSDKAPSPVESWEEEFWKRFHPTYKVRSLFDKETYEYIEDDLKSFIRTLLLSEYERGREDACDYILKTLEHDEEDHNAHSIIEALTVMAKSVKDTIKEARIAHKKL